MTAVLYVDLHDVPVRVDPAMAAELAEMHRTECWTVTPVGSPVVVYVGGVPIPAAAAPGRTFACTQHRDHRGDHHVCHPVTRRVLATWRRYAPEHRWAPDRYLVRQP